MKKNDFIEKAKNKHNNKYDYSRVDYLGSQKDVIIICPIHGEFKQKPSCHLRGDNCPLCGNISRGSNKRFKIEDFIKKSQNIHGEKYSYGNVNYVNEKTLVKVTCKIHGDFDITPKQHLNGIGCPKCKKEKKINEFREIHGDYYDYSLVEFDKDNKVKIICPIHGIFEQRPSKHRLGQGCPQCAKKEKTNKKNTKEFIELSKNKHGEKYEYTEVIYKNSHEKVKITCPIHGVFQQYPYDHYNGHGCPKCGRLISKNEDEIAQFIINIVGENNVERHNRSILNGKEIDIYIPKLKIGVEYNGLIWHSEKNGKDRYYHLEKTINCNKNGVRLIQIFEDEYNEHKDIVLSKIKHILKLDNSPKIYGRKTIIKVITKEIAKDFLEKNHIQGYGKSTISLGAYYADKLISVMTFEKIKEEWILNRFASDIQYNCIGVGGKLINYFKEHYSPEVIKSFADRRWTDSENNIYLKLGFSLDKVLRPEYRYINLKKPDKRIHKFNCRKNILHKQYSFPMSMTEKEMVEKLNLTKVYDCGLFRYILKKEVY